MEARGPQLSVDGGECTTDLASLDEDGFSFIHGRADDALNWGRFKIVPSVLEEALRVHPAVGEASVVGIPDERLGEVPVAAVTLRAEWGAAELQDWLADRLARYQVLAVVKIVNELPRTPSMKVSRPEVQALLDAAEDDQVLEAGRCRVAVVHAA
ncbi:AMP-binding enzyme [Amycolatopsis sp. NPDC003731]